MMKMIRERLKLVGIGITDIERIIITHGHIDHFGLALSIQEAVGHPVQCFIHTEDQWRLSHRHLRKEMWSREADDFVTKVGIPPNKIETITKESGAQSAAGKAAHYFLIDEIFPNLPDNELFLAASDIWAHIEILSRKKKLNELYLVLRHYFALYSNKPLI
jgi:metal-dependent hydrolase (beta-lactamase superfamily II)